VYGQENSKQKTEQLVIYDRDGEVLPFELDKNSLEDYKNDDAYDYREYEEQANWWTNFKNWLGRLWDDFWQWLVGDYDPGSFLGIVIRILPYLLIASVIIFLVWLFIKLNPGSRILGGQKSAQVFFTEEEEIIKTKNIKELIEKAVQNNDYRLAVRYYYLLVLQSLSEKQLIDYEFDKTNSDYIKELKKTDLSQGFQKATTLYDYIWYGNFDVTQENFNKAQHTFKDLERLVSEQL
jgi:hypothetical protein